MMHSMAVLLQLTVTPATQEQFDRFDVRAGRFMMQAGVLHMSHLASPGSRSRRPAYGSAVRTTLMSASGRSLRVLAGRVRVT